MAVISWVLFATEEIGHIIEDPFGRGLTDDPDQTTPNEGPLRPVISPHLPDAATAARRTQGPRPLRVSPALPDMYLALIPQAARRSSRCCRSADTAPTVRPNRGSTPWRLIAADAFS